MFRDRNLSYSQITTWADCRYKHKLQYIEGYRPKQDGIPLMLGGFVHEILAAIILNRRIKSVMSQLLADALQGVESPIMRDLIGSSLEQAYGIAFRTDQYMGITEGRWETLYFQECPLVEYKFSMPIEGWQGYVGIADWVARDRETNKVYLIDWKTRGRLADPRSEELNLQLMTYLHVMREQGIEVDAAAIVQILSKEPAVPKLNLNGTMSRAKITTDWNTYEQALIEAGLDPEDYQDMKEKLNGEFFDFTELYFSDYEVQNAWNSIVEPASLDIQSTPLYERYRSMSPWNCRNCAFKRPCLADLRGHDAQGILEEEFERRED